MEPLSRRASRGCRAANQFLAAHTLSLATAALLALATTATAQTNDHLFRSWSWRTESGSARAAGLAGAFVAVADDPTAPVANPAGLVQIEKLALSAGALHRSQARVGNERGSGLGWLDTWRSRVGLGYIGGGTRLGSRLAAGGYFNEPHAVEATLDEAGLIGGQFQTGELRAIVTEVGGAAAFKVSDTVSLGARVGVSHLQLEGHGSRLDFVGWSGSKLATRELLPVQTAVTDRGANRAIASVGMLARLSKTLRLGATGELGASYECERTVVDSQSAPNVESAGTYDLRQPSRITAGLSWQAFPRMLLVTQVDYVRYSEMAPAVRYGSSSASEYSLNDGVESRTGMELSYPVGEVRLQLRTGMHIRVSGDGAIRYTGADSLERNTWGQDLSSASVAAGGSLVVRHLRLDVGGTLSGVRSTLAVTVSLEL